MSSQNTILEKLPEAYEHGQSLDSEVTQNTVSTLDETDDSFDEEDFFTMEDGRKTLVSRYDLEKEIDANRKTHFEEIQRYWVNKPYSFISIFRSTKENEVKYYAVEPHLTDEEEELKNFIGEKIRKYIKYDDDTQLGGTVDEKQQVIEDKILYLVKDRYNLYNPDDTIFDTIRANLPFGGSDPTDTQSQSDQVDDETDLEQEDNNAELENANTEDEKSFFDRLSPFGNTDSDNSSSDSQSNTDTDTDVTNPERSFTNNTRQEKYLTDHTTSLSDYQLEKIIYYIKRDNVGYQKIDPIKNDINVEDISCDGYNSPVFVYHSDYEQIITNITHNKESLDRFVIKLAQRSGKGISKRNPQVDVTLPDGSRGQLTLGSEVSDHGTNYTIRQFKEVPFTPIDLINWRTFSLDQIAFLWLCIQNHKSLLFAGGTASGKTTSLNAVSLFIPSSGKIVSIEDTREVELPQRNWIASVTRPSFTGDGKGDVDEFDLLEAALRQRPDYIIMGEIRGEEGRTLFQVMSTGHTSYSTFHADSVGEVIKRFTTDPINVSKTMFTALDLISIQSSTRVNENKVRRNKSLTEVNHYDPENDEINVRDVYQWQAETDTFINSGDSQVLEDIKFDKGWSDEKLQKSIDERKLVLAYLIKNGLNTYAEVAATFQAYMNDKQTILTLIAESRLKSSLNNLRTMESVFIDIDPEEEEQTPRPEPDDEIRELCDSIIRDNEHILKEYKGLEVSLESAIPQEEDVKGPLEEIEPETGATPESIEETLGLFDESNMMLDEDEVEDESEQEIQVIE